MVNIKDKLTMPLIASSNPNILLHKRLFLHEGASISNTLPSFVKPDSRQALISENIFSCKSISHFSPKIAKIFWLKNMGLLGGIRYNL
jgi:hypothetical protein